MSVERFFLRFAWAVLAALGLGASARAATADHARARVVSETTSIEPGVPGWIGVWIQLDPGWHTYWKNPGDAGMPIDVAWSVHDNIEIGAPLWPYPEAFDSEGVVGFGYSDETMLLFPVRAEGGTPSGTQAGIEARVGLLLCKDVCIVTHAQVETLLPVASNPTFPDATLAPLFARTRERLPVAPEGWDYSARIEGDAVMLRMTPKGDGVSRVASARFFPEERGVFDNGAPQHWREEEGGYTLRIPLSVARHADPKRLRGVLVGSGPWSSGSPARALSFDFSLDVADSP